MSFVRVVEHMASALAYARREKNSDADSLNPFDRAQPMTSAFAREAAAAQDADRGALLTDVAPRDLGAPIHYALLADTSDPNTGKWSGYQCLAARQLSFVEMRGLPLPFASSAHCKIWAAHLTTVGTYMGGWRFCSWHPHERRWVSWVRGVGVAVDPYFPQRMRLIVGAQFTARYEWHVDLGLPKAPRLTIPCSAEEARQLFATRELPPGKDRRAALLHWVSEHYRRKHGEGEATVFVKAHLRGVDDFVWENMQCTVRPSAFERERGHG